MYKRIVELLNFGDVHRNINVYWIFCEEERKCTKFKLSHIILFLTPISMNIRSYHPIEKERN